MLTTAQIGSIGEKHATAWLSANGWSCYRNTQQPGATDIEAISGNRSILVQVKTAVWPNSPANLSSDEKKAIVGRANRGGKEAWLGQLQVYDDGTLAREITWTKLN